jgi:hypothetical protein
MVSNNKVLLECIILFIIICISGFTLSSVNADEFDTKDKVEHNKIYIPQDLNLITEAGGGRQKYALDNYWFVTLKTNGKCFQSGAGRKDKKGNFLWSDTGYIAYKVGYFECKVDGSRFSPDWYYTLDCIESGEKTKFKIDRSSIINGSFDKNITTIRASRSGMAEAKSNGNNFSIEMLYSIGLSVFIGFEDNTSTIFYLNN